MVPPGLEVGQVEREASGWGCRVDALNSEHYTSVWKNCEAALRRSFKCIEKMGHYVYNDRLVWH